jgi:hypothetical protein
MRFPDVSIATPYGPTYGVPEKIVVGAPPEGLCLKTAGTPISVTMRFPDASIATANGATYGVPEKIVVGAPPTEGLYLKTA